MSLKCTYCSKPIMLQIATPKRLNLSIVEGNNIDSEVFVSNGNTGINTLKGLHLQDRKKCTFIFLLCKIFFKFVPFALLTTKNSCP